MNPAAAPVARYVDPLSDTARWLSHLGLVPFVLGALLVWVVNAEAHPYATLALSASASSSHRCCRLT